MENNIKDLMKGAELLLKGLDGLNTDELDEATQEQIKEAQKQAKEKMANIKKELANFAKMQSKF